MSALWCICEQPSVLLDCCVVQDKKFESIFDATCPAFDAFGATCAASDMPEASDNADVTVYWVQTTKED